MQSSLGIGKLARLLLVFYHPLGRNFGKSSPLSLKLLEFLSPGAELTSQSLELGPLIAMPTELRYPTHPFLFEESC